MKCPRCETENSVTDTVCINCKTTLTTTEYFVMSALSQETLGPLTTERVKEFIAQKQITTADSISKTGDAGWTPIMQSEFGEGLMTQINLNRLSASICPNCGADMVVLTKNSAAGQALILIGIFLSVILCGIVFIIWGAYLVYGQKRKTFYQCPRCHYSTA